MDHLLYNSLNTLSKVIQECGTLLHSDKWRQNMNIIFDHVQFHLRHPDVWVQLAAAQMFGMLFASYKPEDLLSKPANLSGDTIHGYLETNTTPKAVSDQEFAAKRKIKKNLAKQVMKKRRIDELRPSCKARKRNYQEVTAD